MKIFKTGHESNRLNNLIYFSRTCNQLQKLIKVCSHNLILVCMYPRNKNEKHIVIFISKFLTFIVEYYNENEIK